MNKLPSIQALRGIAVLGVVAFHCLAIERKYSGGDLLLPEFFRLGQSGVDLFFVISGFVMVAVTKGRFARSGQMMRFLWGRVTRIYPTYWFYFVLTASVFVIQPNWVNSSHGNQVDFVSSFLLLPTQLPLVMVSWSLVHELWFYIVFTVLLKFHERLLLPLLILWGAVVAVVNLLIPVSEFPLSARVVLHPYSLEFIIGALVAMSLSRGHVQGVSARTAVLMITLILTVGIPIFFALDLLKQEGLLRVTVIGTVYGCVVLLVMALEKAGKRTAPRSLQFIGDISYTVYLSHALVLSAIGRFWLAASPAPSSLLDNMLACLVMLAAVVGYGWVGYRLVEQPILQVSHHLRARWFENGGRKTSSRAVKTDAA